MGSDWTSPLPNSVRFTHQNSDGTTTTCTNDGYSIVRDSLTGMNDFGHGTDQVAFAPGYLSALAAAVRAGHDPRNAAYADAIERDAAAPPGSLVSPETLASVAWVAYLMWDHDTLSGTRDIVPGYSSPANVSFDQPVIAPAVGTSPPPSANGQYNTNVCGSLAARPTPGGVAGWASNPLFVLGMIVAGAFVVNALNQRSPTLKQIRSRR